MQIRYVPHDEIDKVMWNSCVHYAINGNIFGYKWYLDNTAKEWDALVEGEYESVMPLIWNKNRWLGKSLYGPALVRESGIYSIHVLSKKRVETFLEAIPKELSNGQIILNEGTNPVTDSKWNAQKRENYQLLLSDTYEVIASKYAPELQKALQTASEAGLIATSNVRPEEIADLFKAEYSNSISNQQKYYAMLRVMYNTLHRGWGFSSSIKSPKGELLAANFFIYSHGKLLSLVPIVSSQGKESGALAQLFDLAIRTNADRPLILDFNSPEDIDFPKQFGAQTTPFYQLSRKKRWWGG